MPIALKRYKKMQQAHLKRLLNTSAITVGKGPKRAKVVESEDGGGELSVDMFDADDVDGMTLAFKAVGASTPMPDVGEIETQVRNTQHTFRIVRALLRP